MWRRGAWLVVALVSLALASRGGTTIFEADALPGWLGETHRGQAKHSASLKKPTVIMLSKSPRAFLYKNFLTEEECDHIVAVAKPKLERSEVVAEGGKVETDEIRTSWGAFLDMGQDAVVSRIEEKIARWTFLPVENQESMQVLRYGVGQKYEAHTDFFDESDQGNQVGGHRIATVLMYLNHVGHGGETVFPDSEPDKTVKDQSWSECGKRGVAVKPNKGDALLFYSLHPNATTDEASMHAGCPVIKGEKWSATKWIHVRAFNQNGEGANVDLCIDEDTTCPAWAAAGECEKNPGYMMTGCRKSCTKCTDTQ